MKNDIFHQHNKLEVDYIDLRFIYSSISQYRRGIILFSLLLTILSLFYAEFKPAKYQASLLLKIQHGHDFSQPNPDANQPSTLTYHSVQPLSVQIALIQSELVLRPVIQSLHLQPGTTNSVALHSLSDKRSRDVNAHEFEIINRLRSNLTISDLSGSTSTDTNNINILRLSLTGTDPNTLKTVLNKIAATTQQVNARLKKVEAEKSLIFLNKQLPIAKKALYTAEMKLNSYRARSGKIDVKYQTQYLLNDLSEMNKQLEALKQKKINLLESYTENHPVIISLNNEIEQLTHHRDITSYQVRNIPAYEQDILNLTREVNVKNNIYTMLLNQIYQLNVIKSGIVSDIDVLSPPSTPHVLPAIRLSIIAILTFVTGLVLSALFILLWQLCTGKKQKSQADTNDNMSNVSTIDLAGTTN